MRKITSLDEIHAIEFDILLKFKTFCDTHELKYSLGAGTLLGAVRHKGFIPWDDDIDVFMMRSEYDRMISIIQRKGSQSLSTPEYIFMLPLDHDYAYPFVKIVDTQSLVIDKNMKKRFCKGLWIDIFPIDPCCQKMSDNEQMIRRRREYIKNIRRFVTVKGKNGYRTILKQLNNLVQHRIFGKGLSYWIRRCQQIESVSETGYCGTIIWPITIKDVYPAEYFEDYAELEFEKEMFTVFKRYDDILRWRYGDYMQLPDIKERQRHQFDAYIIK